ncbi:hypothetical protein A7R81_17635 [Pseudomonas aeruginosa]|nr:hypothetical protein A7R81_17635 [Pseudomonas aeruginosa]
MQRRGIPRAVLTSGLIVGAFNIFGTLGVLAAVPAEETDVTRIFATPSNMEHGHQPCRGGSGQGLRAAGAVRRGPSAAWHADRLGGTGL